MIGYVDTNGKVTYITKLEDFQDIVSPNLYTAICEWNDQINYTYKDEYDDLASEYNSLQEDYNDLEFDNSNLEDEIEKLSQIVKEQKDTYIKGIDYIKSFIYDELYYESDKIANGYIKERLNRLIEDMESLLL